MRCKPCPYVQQVVLADGVLLIRPSVTDQLRLGYPAAAVWDLVAAGYEARRIVELLSLILLFSESEASELYEKSVAEWLTRQLLLEDRDG